MGSSAKIEQCRSLRYFREWLYRLYHLWKPYITVLLVSVPAGVILALYAPPHAGHLPWYRITGAGALVAFSPWIVIGVFQAGTITGSRIVVAHVAALLNSGHPEPAWAVLNARWAGIHPSIICKPHFQILLVKIFEGIGDDDAVEAIRFLGLTTVPAPMPPPDGGQQAVPHATILREGRTSRKWFIILLIASTALAVLKLLLSWH